MPSPDVLRAAGRALPKIVALALAGAALASGKPFLAGAGAVLLLSAVVTNWRDWWEYVRTGARPAPAPPARYAEPGPHAVTIVEVGRYRIDVIKAVREITDLALVPAKEIVDDTCVVVTDVSAASAAAAAEQLTQAGAEVRITPPLES